MALPRHLRFHNTKLIPMVLKKGAKRVCPFFRVFTLAHLAGEMQIAIVVSKKIAPAATLRNRIKRRISEGIRIVLQSEGTLETPQLFVFLGNQAALEVDFALLQNALKSYFATFRR